MAYHSICELFAGFPAVLCGDNARIARGNREAVLKLKRLSEEESLYDYMEAYDIMRFELAYHHASNNALLFPVGGYHGFHYGVAAFPQIMGRSFSVIALFFAKEKAEQFKEQFTRLSDGTLQQQAASLLELFIGPNTDMIAPLVPCTLIDPCKDAEQMIYRIADTCDFIDCELEYQKPEKAESSQNLLSAVGAENYAKMLFYMIRVLNDLSFDRIIRMKFSIYHTDVEVRMTTQLQKLSAGVSDLNGLAESMPCCASELTLCSYIADSCGCQLYVRTQEETSGLTLALMLPLQEDAHKELSTVAEFPVQMSFA